jgi:hypothetical protein
MRNTDFRERIDAIEKFQIICETETDLAVSNIVLVSTKKLKKFWLIFFCIDF